MNNETIKLTSQDKVLGKNSTEGPVDNIVGLSVKGTVPNRRARRHPRRIMESLSNCIDYEERERRNRIKKLAKKSKKKNK